ncbi:MAG TPA: chemotaxis protein CheW [Anaeromyxobacteraceae bacterium]|nr:chemotaxis protein CheW [Anaeromyxobacteraceae bacterium]
MESPEAGKPPSPGAGAAAPAPRDPLAEFFYREDEASPGVPSLEPGAAPSRPAGPARARREFVAFRLGEEEYAVDIQAVREILRAPVLTEVPRAPRHVAGLVLVRGEVVAVQDPRRRLGLAGTPGPSARVIVCEAGRERVGLLVDSVSEVLRLNASQIEERAQGIASIDADYIVGVGRDDERMVVLLDVAALIGDEAPEAKEAPSP